MLKCTLPLIACAVLCLPFASHAQQHTAESPQILEGPQTPGIAPTRPSEPELMNNDSVLRMHKAGLSDDLILQTISAQPGRYDTASDTLITLKRAGLSDPVLVAISNKARRQLTGTPVPPPLGEITLSPVNEIGLYYKNKEGRWTYIDPELIHIDGGGFIKSTITYGVIKPDKNGSIKGRESKLLLPRPIEFLIYTPEGVSATEYELLRFRLNSKNREFRVLTGGVIHSHGGAERDDVPFTPTRIAPRTWAFTVGRDLVGAEYGILPPGTGNVTNGGKIYTFAISE